MNRLWTDERLRDGGTLEHRRAAALAPFVAGADWLLDRHSMHEPSLPLRLTGLFEENVALPSWRGLDAVDRRVLQVTAARVAQALPGVTIVRFARRVDLPLPAR